MSRWIRFYLYAAMLWLASQAGAAGFNFFNAANPDSIPKTISGTGMYQDLPARRVSDDVVYFDVNAPLWTDGAAKARYIAIPPGTSVVYDDTADAYGYPDRAFVIKNFSVDTVAGDPSSRILFETRFTGLKKSSGRDRWYLFTYRWRPDQSDADLVPDSGQNATVQVRRGAGGEVYQKKWRFPSRLQCAACHRTQGDGGRVVLAFFTSQLNRPLAANPSLNQIEYYFNTGLLTLKAGAARPDLSQSPRWARWDDESASLDVRARSYIAANCSGCHGRKGILTDAALGITIDYDFHAMRAPMDLTQKRLVGKFPIDSAGLLVPGHPERSVLLFRQQMRNQKDLDFSLEEYAMPPLGSYEPDTNAIKLITRWIESMQGTGLRGFRASGPDGAFGVRDGRIYLPASMIPGRGHPVLLDLRGRSLRLAPVSEGVYRIVDAPAPGVHLLLWNGRVVRRILL